MTVMMIKKGLFVFVALLLVGCSATPWPSDLNGTELEPINKSTHTEERK